jgi:hypothetical protein
MSRDVYHAQGGQDPVANYNPTDLISVHGFIGWPSTDKTPVQITLGHTTKLSIPRNYLINAAPINPWPDMWLDIRTSYPDFKGVDESAIRRGHFPWYVVSTVWDDAPNVINIHRETTLSYEARKANKLIALDKMVKEVGPLNTNPAKLGGFQSTYVKYRGSKENSLIISCPGHNAPWTIAEYCTVYVPVAPSFVVMYQFRPPLLPHWQEIDDGVMKLLNSFVVR